MRLTLALGGLAIFLFGSVLAFALRPAVPEGHAAAAATEHPRYTADPAAVATADPEADRGRLAFTDRTDRRR